MFVTTVNAESSKMLIMDNNMDPSDAFKKLYKSKGFNQSTLANAAGLDRATINKWVNKGVRPDPESLTAVAKALKMPPSTLFRMFGLQPKEKGISDRIDRIVFLLNQLDDYDVAEIEEIAEAKVRRAESRDQIDYLIAKMEALADEEDQAALREIYEFLLKIGAHRVK